MFSFHKPKIYRSISGCCICRAKSSSSRFTDSKKYEAEFEKCFRIDEKRSGEICNACVLLVKRWKKLPTGTNKNWHHVVDARAGPGTKSFKTNTSSSGSNNKSSNPSGELSEKKHRQLSSKLNRNNRKLCLVKSSSQNACSSSSESEPSSDADEMDVVDCVVVDEMIMCDELDPMIDQDDHISVDGGSNRQRSLRRSTRLAATARGSRKSPSVYDDNELITYSRTNGTGSNDEKHSNQQMLKKHRSKSYRDQFVSFLDANIWKREKICCGIIFKGPNNEVLIYPELFQPCSCRTLSLSSNSTNSLNESEQQQEQSPQKQQNKIYSSFNNSSLSSSSMKNNLSNLEVKSTAVDSPDPQSLIPTLIKQQKNFDDEEPEESSNQSMNDKIIQNTPPPALINSPSFHHSNSNSSTISSGSSNHQMIDEIDDQSSGVLSMVGPPCDENSLMQDDYSISDRLSTVSSSLLDQDDGNTSSSSETFEQEHVHDDHDHLVKSPTNHHHSHHHPKTAGQTNNPPPSLAVV